MLEVSTRLTSTIVLGPKENKNNTQIVGPQQSAVPHLVVLRDKVGHTNLEFFAALASCPTELSKLDPSQIY